MKRDFGAEQPYTPLGPFKLRIPFVHYKFAWPDYVQGLLVCAVCLSAVPMLQEYLGMPFDIAITIVILNGILYCTHVLLGDPVVPGWVTPAIPILILYVSQFETGPDRMHALIAFEFMLGFLAFVLGASGLGRKMIKIVPNAMQAGIIVGAGIAAVIVVSLSSGDISVRHFYNEALDYRFYMIPAFIIILVLLICCFIPALNLVVEKERGTIEQINVTPVSRFEFTLSKLIPYWLVGIVVLTEAILTAGLVYGLWPAGNAGTIYLAALLFALTMSGFAIAVANISDTMQQCIFVLFFFVMIFMLMSGMLTPLESMPQWAQWITVAFPPRWFVGIMRAVYLKGTTLAELAPNFLALLLLAIAFCSIAMLTYRKQR